MNHIFLDIHTYVPPKKNVQILEPRPQSSKNAQKWIKICKFHDVDKSILVFGFQSLFVFFLELSKEKN